MKNCFQKRPKEALEVGFRLRFPPNCQRTKLLKMKNQKLYIQLILLIGLSLCFNQKAFSKIDSYPSQKNEQTFKSSQKENLQKRLRQQRKKAKAFKKKHLTKKGQGINDFGSKLLWIFIFLVIAILGALLIKGLESFLLVGIGVLLMIIGLVGLYILIGGV